MSRVFLVLGWHKLFIESPQGYSCGQIHGASVQMPAGSTFLTGFKCEFQGCTMTISVLRGTPGVLTSRGSLPHPELLLTSTLTSCLFLSSVPACNQDFSAPNRMPRLSPLQVCTAAWQIKTVPASTLSPACPSSKLLLNRVSFWLYVSVSN